MTDIHLVSWNRPKMTELVIKTIHRNTPKDSFRLVVLDNGSSGNTPDMLQKLQDQGLIDELLLFKTNMGLEGARNLLLNNATQSDRFVCVDNDCLPPR
jgi:glycosyltransferase involved in cell wall biosynthesis